MNPNNPLHESMEKYHIKIRRQIGEMERQKKRQAFMAQFVQQCVKKIVCFSPSNVQLLLLLDDLSKLLNFAIKISDNSLKLLAIKLRGYLIIEGDISKYSIRILRILSDRQQKIIFQHPQVFIQEIIGCCFTPDLVEDGLMCVENLLRMCEDSSVLRYLVNSTPLESEISNILQNQIIEQRINLKVLFQFFEIYLQKIPGSQLDQIILEYIQQFFVFRNIENIEKEVYPLLRILSERNDLMAENSWKIIILNNLNNKQILLLLLGIVKNYEDQYHSKEIFSSICSMIENLTDQKTALILIQILQQLLKNAHCLPLLPKHQRQITLLLQSVGSYHEVILLKNTIQQCIDDLQNLDRIRRNVENEIE